jgi:hypothetical protein
MEVLNQLRVRLPEEQARLSKISNTLEGIKKLKDVYIKQFGGFNQGDNIIYELARVNVIKELKGEEKLI